MGDVLGRRRMFIAGVIVFTIGSALCGLAPSIGGLVAARVLQGVGGAMMRARVRGQCHGYVTLPGNLGHGRGRHAESCELSGRRPELSPRPPRLSSRVRPEGRPVCAGPW